MNSIGKDFYFSPLSIDNILEEYVLNDINRYNHRLRLHDENVATHSFFVSLICLKLMKYFGDYLTINEKYEIMVYATLHDVPEIVTSDIPHDVKQAYPDFNEFLEKIEVDFYQNKWKEFSNIVIQPSDIVNLFVKLADSYSVLQFCSIEKMLGHESNEIEIIYKDSIERIETLSEKIILKLGVENNAKK